MTYTQLVEKDLPEIKAFCAVQQIAMPETGLVFIARNDKNLITGLVGVRTITIIEPLISENPIVANNLYNMALGFLVGTNVPKIYALVKSAKDKFIKTMEKVGFVITDKDMTILERDLNG